MIKSKKFLVTLFATFFVVCFVGMAEVENNPVAEVMVETSGINIIPRVNYTQLDISLSRADGSVIQMAFNSGSTPYLDLSTILGESSCDGLYTYELRVISAVGKSSRDSEGFSSKSRINQSQEVLTQTGYFTVQGGMIITPVAIEPENVMGTSTSQDGLSRTQDQVILDDLIVDGSACIGFDCYNGESFGFDTLRLKENNLRIKFQDTSSSASFPSNDWQITANDSSNGGANKFSIDDIDSGKTPFTIEAGTRANALYVDDSGRVGLGTSTPAEDLHIWYGDTPTIRLHQSGSGWAPQTWDIAGNEANFFIRDVTNGSNLPLRIQPNTPGDTLCLKSGGKVGIGTWSPNFKLEVQTTNENAAIVAERTDGALCYVNATNQHGNFGTTTNHPLRLIVAGDERMKLPYTGNLLEMSDGGYYDGTWHGSSSREMKENIQMLTSGEAMEALEGLDPVKFNYKTNKDDEHVGFIAEDVPELVASKNRKAMSAMDVVAVLTKVVQEQQKFIQEQQRINCELKKKIAELENK
jgi:hypothetical protein